MTPPQLMPFPFWLLMDEGPDRDAEYQKWKQTADKMERVLRLHLKLMPYGIAAVTMFCIAGYIIFA